MRDDGAGFEPDQVAPNNLGLSIMRERAEAIGATLTVDSETGEGTEVIVIWNAALTLAIWPGVELPKW